MEKNDTEIKIEIEIGNKISISVKHLHHGPCNTGKPFLRNVKMRSETMSTALNACRSYLAGRDIIPLSDACLNLIYLRS